MTWGARKNEITEGESHGYERDNQNWVYVNVKSFKLYLVHLKTCFNMKMGVELVTYSKVHIFRSSILEQP